MSTTPSRLELRVDILDKKNQRALALSNLTAAEFVQAILREFRELEYLSDAPADYVLFRASDKSMLDAAGQLQPQVTANERLVLVEARPALPAETRRPAQNIYLRDLTTGKVYKLNWLPAVIGRPDKNQPYDDWIAVNLEAYQAGLRVSRRQAMITEDSGRYFVESMSRNPTAIKRESGELVPVDTAKQPLNHGDVIFLERSNISLKFIVRAVVAPTAEKNGAVVK